jgi:hypothetical protein
VAIRACGNVVGRIALRRQCFPACQDRVADDGRCRRRKWRLPRSEIVRHRPEIWIWQKFQEVVHRRIFAPAVTKRYQLIVLVAGRLARKPREIIVVGTLALVAMA